MREREREREREETAGHDTRDTASGDVETLEPIMMGPVASVASVAVRNERATTTERRAQQRGCGGVGG